MAAPNDWMVSVSKSKEGRQSKLGESFQKLKKTVADITKPGPTGTSSKAAYEWNKPGGGYERFVAKQKKQGIQGPK